MAEREVLVLCYWNGCVKYGPNGVYYEGATPRKISVKQKTKLSRLVDGLYIITGVDKQRSNLELSCRYPVAISPHLLTYVHIPVVDDASLETMLEVPSNHPSINSVELYLEVKPIIDPAACSMPLENHASSSKRQRTQQPQEGNGSVAHPPVKLERDIGLEVQGVHSSMQGGRDEEMTDKNSGLDVVTEVVNLTSENGDLDVPGLEASANACLNKGIGSSASKPLCLSSLWLDEHELNVGLCFKDRDELKKVVDWCSIRGQQKCVLQEIREDEYKFECSRWRCNWLLCAEKREEHGMVEITKCSGPHACCPPGGEKFTVELAAEEIECLIRVQPTLTVAQLKSWWFEKFGYKLRTTEMQEAKKEVIKKLYGDWDQSFRVLPKLMAALHSSNELVVDWQYDICPNPEFAYFRGVFWAFSQTIEGFHHCKPVIVVDTKDYNNGKYSMTVMIAAGMDADDYFFPLAFAVTKEVSIDTWRWFLTGIREKVTQRKGICLISSPHPDILAVIKEPESRWQEPWAYHRLCLDHLSSKFHDVFQNSSLESLVQQAGSTKQQDEFDSHMETIRKENPEARQWLDQMPPHQWALAHDGGRRYEVIKINTEALFSVYESVWSLGLPVTATALLLFDELRLDFQHRLSDIRGRIKCGDMYSKLVMDKFKEFKAASITYVVMPLDNNAFQVTTPLQKNGWIVQLSESMCTCGEFQVEKIPCLHALAVCEKLRINPLQYVDNFHSVERLCKTYAATFNPVPQVSAWPEASGVPTLLPPVIPTPPTNVSAKSQCKTTPRTTQKSETSPKTYSKRKSPEKPTVEPLKSTSKEKPAPPSLTNLAGKSQYKTTPCTTQKSDKSPNASSKRKKTEKPTKEQSKPASKTKQVRGKKKDKSKELPSDEELRNAIIDILKMVDLDTVTFADINKLLADKFKVDFTQRKTYIKSMIDAEFAKIVDKGMSEENE